jgi:hypothetical protein
VTPPASQETPVTCSWDFPFLAHQNFIPGGLTSTIVLGKCMVNHCLPRWKSRARKITQKLYMHKSTTKKATELRPQASHECKANCSDQIHLTHICRSKHIRVHTASSMSAHASQIKWDDSSDVALLQFTHLQTSKHMRTNIERLDAWRSSPNAY